MYDLFVPSASAEELQAGLRLAQRRVETVLDVAGGTGRAARALTDTASTLSSTTSTLDTPVVLDISAAMLARAAAAGLPAIRGDARRPPIKDDAVDAIVITDALHHVPEPGTALEACVDLVAPGGVIVIREFDPMTRRGRLLVALERLARMDSVFFEPDELAASFRKMGLDSTVVERGFGYTVVGVVPEEGDGDSDPQHEEKRDDESAGPSEENPDR